MRNQFALERATYGRPAIGRMATMDITGCLGRGSWRRPSVISGRPAIGAGEAAGTFFTQDIGDRTLDSTAELIMDLATAALASLADAGTAEFSLTTRR